jgi:hypothetical protein
MATIALLVFCSSNFGFLSSIVVIYFQHFQLDTAIRYVSHEAKFVATRTSSSLLLYYALIYGYRIALRFISYKTYFRKLLLQGHSIAQAVSRQLLTTAARVWLQVQSCCIFWRTKWHCDRFYRSTSVSPANSHTTSCSAFITRNINAM